MARQTRYTRLAAWPLENSDSVKVQLVEAQDGVSVDIRRWRRRESDGVEHPTSHGIRVPLVHVRTLHRALNEVLAMLHPRRYT